MINYLPTAVGLTFVDSAPLDSKVLFLSKEIRDLYEPAFLYEGALAYTVKEDIADTDTTFYHKVDKSNHNRGFYFVSNKNGVVTWTGLIADTVDDKHAYGIIDSASTVITNPNTSNNITDHINYIYSLVSGLTSGRTWKDPVTNFVDLATTYHTPEIGWTAAVTSTNILYVYNGSTWVATTGNTPMLSATTDGSVSMTWYTDLYDIVTNTDKYLNVNTYQTFEFRNSTGVLLVNGTKTATTTTDTFIFKQGSNISFTVDASTKTVTINSTAAASLYTNATPTTATVGGIISGSTFTDKTMTEMWDMLLYPYQYPSFTGFSISGQSTTLEFGLSVPANPTFTWGYSNLTNIVDNSIKIIDTTNSNTILINNVSKSITTQQVVKTALVYTTPISGNSRTHTFSIEGTNTKNTTFTSSTSITWTYKTFKGASANPTLSDADIFNLTNTLTSSKGTTLKIDNSSSVYFYYCLPVSYGTVEFYTPLKDEAWTPTIRSLTRNGVSIPYRIYRTNNLNSGSYNITIV